MTVVLAMEATVVELWETRVHTSGRWARPHFGRVAGEISDIRSLPADPGCEWHGRCVRLMHKQLRAVACLRRMDAPRSHRALCSSTASRPNKPSCPPVSM